MGQETAALQDFSPAYDRLGSLADIAESRGACPFCANNRLAQRSKLHPYSITPSTRQSNKSGTLRPSAVAVLRLIRQCGRIYTVAPISSKSWVSFVIPFAVTDSSDL